MTRLRFGAVLGSLFALCLAGCAEAVVAPRYKMAYHAQFLPGEGVAAVEIRTERGTGRLVDLDLNMPADTYSGESGDGVVERRGARVLWTPPQEGGTLRFRVRIDHRRGGGDGAYDSRMTKHFVITRGDRLFPSAQPRVTKGARAQARLTFALPAGWDDIETQYTKLRGGAFAVRNSKRRFDRPVGWIAAGGLATTRETILGTRVTLTQPDGEDSDAAVALALLRQALPEMQQAFGELPDKVLIVRASDPMWRGGLSAPSSFWLHAARPLLSANGTSPLLHELTHVLTGIFGDDDDDWISEGIAEYYSLEIGRRAGLISQSRFDKAIASAGRSGAQVERLRGSASNRDRTRKAVALFAALDAELSADGDASLDQLALRLMRRDAVTLAELRADAKRISGRESVVLAGVR